MDLSDFYFLKISIIGCEKKPIIIVKIAITETVKYPFGEILFSKVFCCSFINMATIIFR